MNTILVTLVVVLCIVYISNRACQTNGELFYTGRIKENKTKPKVYDIAHRFLPNYANTVLDVYIRDIFVVFFTAIPFLFAGDTKPFKDYLSMYLVVILLRCLAINITILPKTKTDIVIDKGAYDKIFSGHFATLFLATIVFYKYKIISNIYILSLLNIINAFIILSTRAHYTIDIIVSILVVLLVYKNQARIPV